MMEPGGSCEANAMPDAPAGGSRVVRFGPDFRWQGVPVTEYKQAAEHWAGVGRTVLVGNAGERTAFHLRYFEVGPGGFTSLEEHAHEHAVVVLRGAGRGPAGKRSP